jgi:hypothetical protein
LELQSFSTWASLQLSNSLVGTPFGDLLVNWPCRAQVLDSWPITTACNPSASHSTLPSWA